VGHRYSIVAWIPRQAALGCSCYGGGAGAI
jgi:hypothetical protein